MEANTETISKEKLLECYRDLSDGYDILQEKLHEALAESQKANDKYNDLIKLIINENPDFLSKIKNKLLGLNAAIWLKLNKHERKILLKIIKGD